jgi:hypothetical protein
MPHDSDALQGILSCLFAMLILSLKSARPAFGCCALARFAFSKQAQRNSKPSG